MKNLKNIKKQLVAGMLVLYLVPAFAFGAHYESTDLYSALSDALGEVKEHGAEKTLVVFDIDNTLLAANHDLGSDAWWGWQSKLIKSGDLAQAVAPDIDGLIDAQYILYRLGNMRETQEDADELVARIQDLGVSVIALTARGSEVRDVTMRELRHNGYDFTKSAIGEDGGFAGNYLPYELETLEAYGLSRQDAEAWRLKAPKAVSYVNGVFMASGQHKGAMLRTLLKKVNRSFDAIIFVDDKEKNTNKMTQGFEGTAVDLTTIRYTREDAVVAAFDAKPKDTVIRQWNTLSSVLKDIFAN